MTSRVSGQRRTPRAARWTAVRRRGRDLTQWSRRDVNTNVVLEHVGGGPWCCVGLLPRQTRRGCRGAARARMRVPPYARWRRTKRTSSWSPKGVMRLVACGCRQIRPRTSAVPIFFPLAISRGHILRLITRASLVSPPHVSLHPGGWLPSPIRWRPRNPPAPRRGLRPR